MKIAVDLDGVCYEFDKTARYMLREVRGVQYIGLENPSSHWEYQDSFPLLSDADLEWLWTEGVAQGLWRYGHMVRGARLGLEALVRQGHKLIIVTHRPENAVSDTLEWAGLYFKDIPLAGFHMLSQREPKTTVPWDALIDDKPENIQHAEDAGRIGILFDQPWNQSATPIWRVRDWHQMGLGVEWVMGDRRVPA